MRKIKCPFVDGAFIVMPDRWFGRHASRRDAALEQAREKKLGETLTRFAVAMSLLDDWSLPGLSGNPEKWDLEGINLEIIAWVNNEVLPDFLACLVSPATYSKRFGNGQAASEIPTPDQAGDSNTTG